MSRVARIVVPGFPHPVTQRGNCRADVFETDEDRRAYLRGLKHYADKYGLAIRAYCLMSHHIHLVVVPEREKCLAKALRDAHTVHAMRLNARTGRSGHLFFRDGDRRLYLDCLLQSAERFGLRASACCSMSNPVRLFAPW